MSIKKAVDETEEFLDEMPEVRPGETFLFDCNPEVPCFKACCSDLNLMLTPYDVLRLRRSLRLGSEDFINQRAKVSFSQETGFPMEHLAMLDDAARSCPFLVESGCSVYQDRPAACRYYPVGRGCRRSASDELIERHFLVKEEHCRGFEKGRDWTIEQWTDGQGLEPYKRMSDRYMDLMARQRGMGPITPKLSTMALLALYQLDSFQGFIKNVNLFSRVDVSDEDQAIMLEDEEALLPFAFNWMELVIFGDCPDLGLRQ